MHLLIKKYWFFAGLLLLSAAVLMDKTKTVAGIGKCLREHHGPDVVVFFVFLFSGLMLNIGLIRSGFSDVKGTLIALGAIFLIAPLAAALFSLTLLDPGICIGFFIVAVMPTTLSSGVVMTGAAGGNMAHALVITVLANWLAVFTIPVLLSFLLMLKGGTAAVSIDKLPVILKLAFLVILPLCIGLLIKFYAKSDYIDRLYNKLQNINQSLILGMVWMALSQTRNVILGDGKKIGIILLLVFAFHIILLVSVYLLTVLFGLGQGKRESVIFMGSQKTLPLSVILQTTLFPQYGLALAVCVLHHIVQLIVDGYIMGKIKNRLQFPVPQEPIQIKSPGLSKNIRPDRLRH